VNFIMYALAVWRVSNILVNEEGPFQLASKLRQASGIEYSKDTATSVAVSWPDWNPLHCVLCTSVWVAVIIRAIPSIHPVFAASAVAAFLEGWKNGD
jgi:hypothetical protein